VLHGLQNDAFVDVFCTGVYGTASLQLS